MLVHVNATCCACHLFNDGTRSARVGVSMIMSFSACGNPQALIHSHKSHKANHNCDTQKKILVRFHHDESYLFWRVFTEKDFWEQMEQCIPHQSAYCESHHYAQ